MQAQKSNGFVIWLVLGVSLSIKAPTSNFITSKDVSLGNLLWLFLCFILNVKLPGCTQGDIEYACHSRVLLQQTCLLERVKKTKKKQNNFARFSLFSELNVLTITPLLTMR